MVHCCASGGQATFEGAATRNNEAVSRIEFDSADLGREEDQAFAVDVGSESLSAIFWPTKASSEYLEETILAFA